MNLNQLKTEWVDNETRHKHIHELFTDLVNKDPLLDAHRTYVENNVFGMGERSFQYLWKLICEELPENPVMLEIGVHKGQIISLWKLLRPDAKVYGITPLDGRGTGWTDDDYSAHIKNIHDDFELEQPTLLVGGSEDIEIIRQAQKLAPFDLQYVDGGHERHHIDNDLSNYAPFVKQGGFLVIDDACCDMSMPWGYFQGIMPVTDGVVDYMKEHSSEWEFITNVVHLRVYKRL